MNTITTTNLFISTLEISTLTGKTHSHVLRDTREMISELEKDQSPEMDPLDYTEVFAENKMTKEILLSKYLTEILVTGYSIVLRARVIKRLHELEQELQNTPKLPLTYLEALQCHLNDQLLLEQKNKEIEHQENQIQDMSTKIEQQEDKIQEDKPLVEFAQTIALSSTNLKMSEYAKVISKELGYGRNTLYKLLRDKKIYTTKNLPYQSYINKGYFVVVESVHKNVISLVVTITPLGQQKLLAYLKKHNT